MVNFPIEPPNPLGAFDVAQQFLGAGSTSSKGFQAESVSSTSGFGTRQSRVPNNRPAVSTRKLIHWFIPEQPIVQMYINPQNIVISEKKSITSQRTKGGHLLQYWGEELTTVRLSGTTGTSGIEGINVLRDVYRSEQLAIDPYALFLAATSDQSSIQGLGSTIGNAIGGEVGSLIGSVAGSLLESASTNVAPPVPGPSLAQLAFSVEMYWSGEVFRGYFQSFSLTESAESLGFFNYDIEFIVTQRRGIRQNFLAWHRSATSGPSNSNPLVGTPYSFGPLVPGDQPTVRQPPPEDRGILQSIGDSFGLDIF